MQWSTDPHALLPAQADQNNHLIRRIVISSGTVSTLAGAALSIGSTNGVGAASRFNLPFGVAMDAVGAVAIIVSTKGEDASCSGVLTQHALVCMQTDQNNNLIRRINVSSGSVTTLAGIALSMGSTNGVGTAARFNSPYGVAMDDTGTVAIVVSGEHWGSG